MQKEKKINGSIFFPPLLHQSLLIYNIPLSCRCLNRLFPFPSQTISYPRGEPALNFSIDVCSATILLDYGINRVYEDAKGGLMAEFRQSYYGGE